MQNRAFTISFIVAALAVSMVYSYVSSTEEAYRLKYGKEVTVVVAKKDIRELDILDETNLTMISMPASFKQPGTSQNIEEVRGALAIAPILKDEQITRSKLTQTGVRSGLARQVSVGKRGVTIAVNEQNAVAKQIKPGDRVDVLATYDPTGSGNPIHKEVRTVLQDVLVLATGKFVNNTTPIILERDPFNTSAKPTKVQITEYNQYSNLTLEVDPFEAQKLVYANQNMGIYLVLRNNDDNTKEDLARTKMEDVVNARAPASGGAPAGR